MKSNLQEAFVLRILDILYPSRAHASHGEL